MLLFCANTFLWNPQGNCCRDTEQHSSPHQAAQLGLQMQLSTQQEQIWSPSKSVPTQSPLRLRHGVGCVLAPRSELHPRNTISKPSSQCHRKIKFKNACCKPYTTKSQPTVTVIWCCHVITIPFISTKEQFSNRSRWQRVELAFRPSSDVRFKRVSTDVLFISPSKRTAREWDHYLQSFPRTLIKAESNKPQNRDQPQLIATARPGGPPLSSCPWQGLVPGRNFCAKSHGQIPR